MGKRETLRVAFILGSPAYLYILIRLCFNNGEDHIEFGLYNLSPLCHIRPMPRFAVWEETTIHIHFINKLYFFLVSIGNTHGLCGLQVTSHTGSEKCKRRWQVTL